MLKLDCNDIDCKIYSFDWIHSHTADDIVQDRKLRNLRMHNDLFKTDTVQINNDALRIQMDIKRDNPEYELDPDAEDQLEKFVELGPVLQRNWLIDGGVNQNAIYKKEPEENRVNAIKETNKQFVAKRDRFVNPSPPDTQQTTADLLRQLVNQKNSSDLRRARMMRR